LYFTKYGNFYVITCELRYPETKTDHGSTRQIKIVRSANSLPIQGTAKDKLIALSTQLIFIHPSGNAWQNIKARYR
jgi:hypothetical protein